MSGSAEVSLEVLPAAVGLESAIRVRAAIGTERLPVILVCNLKTKLRLHKALSSSAHKSKLIASTERHQGFQV